jgi:hypothetical protein
MLRLLFLARGWHLGLTIARYVFMTKQVTGLWFFFLATKVLSMLSRVCPMDVLSLALLITLFAFGISILAAQKPWLATMEQYGA